MAKRVLLCALSGRGFVNPLVGVASALRRAGNDCAFALHPEAAEPVLGNGFKRIPRTARDGASFELAHWSKPLYIAMQVKHVEYAIAVFQPDVVVTNQLCLGPLIAARRCGLPIGVLGLATYLWPRRPKGQDRADEATAARREWYLAEMVGFMNQARALFGLAALSDQAARAELHGDRFFLQSVPEFQDGGDGLPETVRFVGSCVWEPQERDPELSAWLDDAARAGEQVAYAQIGRSFGSPSPWPTLRETQRRAGVRLAAATARLDCEVGAAHPAMFARPHLWQGQVLARATVMAASGHTTAVLGGLSFGVPMVLFPNGSGTPDIAAMCRDIGTARVLPPDLSEEQLAAAVSEVAKDAAMRASCARAAAAFARCDGHAAVAAELVALAR